MIASVIMSLLPFSGVGGLMISPEFLTVLMAALAAIGVGDECAGISPSISDGVDLLAVGDARRVPVGAEPLGQIQRAGDQHLAGRGHRSDDRATCRTPAR